MDCNGQQSFGSSVDLWGTGKIIGQLNFTDLLFPAWLYPLEACQRSFSMFTNNPSAARFLLTRPQALLK